MNLKDITGISARYTSGNAGGLIDVRVGAANGPVLGTITMGSTGSWETHASSDVVPITDPGGTNTLFFVARSASGARETCSTSTRSTSRARVRRTTWRRRSRRSRVRPPRVTPRST
ncbi:carbohydrate-binding protein [Oerskovia sp. M15]